MVTCGRVAHFLTEMKRTQMETPTRKHRCLGPILWVRLLFVGIGLANLGRAGMGLWYQERLPNLPMTVSWAYLAVLGVVWGGVFLFCALALTPARLWSRRVALAAATLYQAHIWVHHLAFDANDYARMMRPRDAVLSLLFLALVWGLLSRPNVDVDDKAG